jgi:polysaccharide biosynthesis/export protein
VSVALSLAVVCVLAFSIMYLVGIGHASAQETASGTATTANTKSDISPLAISEERYRIGAGDVLDIRVFNRPQLSRESVRVEPNGMIQMPLIETNIRAACLSESELAAEIARLYKKYQRNPYVNVFVKEYSSTPVAVIGQVEKPGRFQLTRRVRLLELLAFAGGPTDKAGGRVQIAHTGSISICESPDAVSKGVFDFYSLKDAMQGGSGSNPYINAGDIVSIPEADEAYVVGNVFKPTVVLLKEPVTVSQAVAKAGGALRASKLSGVNIVRTSDSGGKTVIPVDLSAISKLRAPDILLQPNDIVAVPTDEGKIFLDKVFGALTGGLSSVPYILR